MKEPTKEETAKFWTGYGFVWIPPVTPIAELDHFEKCIALSNWKYPDGSTYFWEHTEGEAVNGLPVIDLNNLFKYAVPKLRDYSENNTLWSIEFHWQGINISNAVECNVILDDSQFDGEGETEALALFWALNKVREAE
ncbi:hypothetical protein LCGC14_3017270 [marine sediment metagenome]|uniref:Phage ABA sandwich domain-containing protein n=1 Tax=marine sediment metagenome TaxID=412755 RepID=A0A0F8WW98_9ZZZZ